MLPCAWAWGASDARVYLQRAKTTTGACMPNSGSNLQLLTEAQRNGPPRVAEEEEEEEEEERGGKEEQEEETEESFILANAVIEEEGGGGNACVCVCACANVRLLRTGARV